MPEEKRDEYQIIAYRYDLVTITAEEYRQLISSDARNQALATERLHDWAAEKRRADDLAAKVEELAAEADCLRKQMEEFKVNLPCDKEAHFA